MAEPEVTGTTDLPSAGAEPEIDGFFIGGMVCVALGGIFLIIAVIYLVIWCARHRQTKQQEKLRRRHLEHMRHLEEYSIKAGYSPNDVINQNNNRPVTPSGESVFKWESQDLVNLGYVSEDTLERLSQSGQKGPKLDAHINGSSSSFVQQRPRSQTGSLGSRQNSVSSVVDATGGAANGAIRTKNVINNRERDSDRLADVPV